MGLPGQGAVALNALLLIILGNSSVNFWCNAVFTGFMF